MRSRAVLACGDVMGSSVINGLKYTKLVLYGVLICLAIWWLYLGHPLYTWDTFLWIGGFTAIEMNLKQWRNEIVQEGVSAQVME